MAIYHFEAQIISRSQGRSSVAAAAYRAAEILLDERTGLTHNFTHKADVVESEILLPQDAPEWMRDREKLWNAVEASEKRKDAQVAREINIALPKELSLEENWQTIKSFVQKEFVDKGMIADVNFHLGHKSQEEQPHAHVMLTMREVNQNGFGQKVRSWNDKELLVTWREHWAEHCNLALVRAGFDLTIDHRTLEAQGINLEPQTKIGAKSASQQMARFAEHQEIARRNGERLLKNPEMALKALTQQQSTFTHQDLARFVNRHSVDAEQFSTVFEKIKSHESLVHLGKDDRQRDRFTTREMLNLETKMIDQTTALNEKFNHRVSDIRIERIAKEKGLSAEQEAALRHVTQGSDASSLVGFAGTGKSYMLGAAREVWESKGYRVQGMALAGIAVESLESGSGIKSSTIASRQWHWQRGRQKLNHLDIVVVDEAGMLGSRQMAMIVDEVHQAGAKLVLVGDPEQLQAIEAGAAFRAITERTGFFEMKEIRRQKEVWQQEATINFATQQTAVGLRAYEAHDNIHTFNSKQAAITGMIAQWDEVRSQSPEKSQIMLAYTRDEVLTLNLMARELCRENGELGLDHDVTTARGPRTFAENDRIYFLRNNNQELKVKNGTLGTIEQIRGDKFMVRLDGEGKKSRTVEVDLNKYNDIDYGYAATVYKSQGITVDRTHVLGSKYFDRHSTYVAMSRHREGADLYYSRDDFPTFNSLVKNLERDRSKDVSLDYAAYRSFDIDESVVSKEHERIIDKPKEEVSMSLTEDRLARAEKRLAERQYQNEMREVVKQVRAHTGLEAGIYYQEGDRGIYKDSIEVDGKKYGIIEKENGGAFVVPADKLDSKVKGKAMVIETHTNYKGEERLRAIQPEVQERSRGMSLEL